MKRNKLFKNLRNNKMLIFLVIAGIFNDFTLRALTIGNAFKLKPLVSSIAIILVVSILALFLNYKNRNYLYISLSFLFALLSGGNYLYYKHFNSFLSFSLIKQFKQFTGMDGTLTKTLDLKVLVFFIPSLALILIFKKLKKSGYFIGKKPTVRREVLRPFAIGTFILTILFLSLSSTDISRLVKQWNRPYLVDQLGIYSYATADIVKNTLANNESKLRKEDKDKYKNSLEDLVDKNIRSIKTNEYKDIFKGRDIYVIHYESAQTFAMDLEFKDGPVTPFLNKMAREGIYFSNFYPQHSIGTSSDSEFTFSTSLLPLNNGTVFMTHADREYVSLQKLLKDRGYLTLAMHGNNGDFWNRDIMYKNLAYDKFFSKIDYTIDEEIGLGLSDKSFFTQSINKIKKIKEEEKKPIMASLITLSNHFPFDEVDKYGDYSVDHLEGSPIGNYLKSYHYADSALKTFIEGMEKEGLLENALVILYGDHHAKISEEDYEMVFNYDEKTNEFLNKENPNYINIDNAYLKQIRRTPLLIWSKDLDQGTRVEIPMGMVDVLPTLSNMLGIFNPFQIGKDIFSLDTNTVAFPNGDYVDEGYFYQAANSSLYNLKTNTIVEDLNTLKKYEKIQVTQDEQIDLSLNIIENDLIRYFNEVLDANKLRTSLSIRLK